MRFIRSLDHFLRAYSPSRLLRDFLRNCPAYTRGDYVTPPPKTATRPTAYRDDIYENTQPNFGDEDLLYSQQREIDRHLFESHLHTGRLFQASQQEDMSNGDMIERGPMSDEELIDRAIDAVKNGLIPVSFGHEPLDRPPDDPSHEPDRPDDDPYAEPFDAPFDEPFEESYTFDNDLHAEPFDAPFDEPFDPSAGFPFFDAPAETLDDRVEEAYDGMADAQDDMYDDPYGEQSLQDMVDDPMDEPDGMPEPEPEPEPMDPMDDPLHPYMPYGGFFFPFGG